jgi:hypothetical protein
LAGVAFSRTGKIKEFDSKTRFEWGWFFKRKIKEIYFINKVEIEKEFYDARFEYLKD